MGELKSCPFCAGRGIIAATLDDMYRPMCEQDGCACLDGYITRAEAVTAWNTRAAMQTNAAPVAWMYTHEDGSRFFSSVRQTQPFHDMAPGRKNGWTETPLYTADRIEALTADGARGQGCIEPAKRMERNG